MIEILTKNQRKILVSFTNYKNIIDSKKMVKNKRLNSHLMINQKKAKNKPTWFGLILVKLLQNFM